MSPEREKRAAQAAFLATRALLDEVCVTPKPGLVDRANQGSHRDMDIFTFTASAAALAPYWGRCVRVGTETGDRPPEETFALLRQAGKEAEGAMFAATGGVNTHKGVIFSLGTVCGAVGRLLDQGALCREVPAILAECAAMTRRAVEADFAAMTAGGTRDTAGQRLFLDYGLRGIRGEVADGLPSVSAVALPALDAAEAAELSRNDAGRTALLRLIAQVTDTNMIARGGRPAAEEAGTMTARLLERSPFPSWEEVEALDRVFIVRNLSPGGCADLLAIALFLHDWRESTGLF